MFVDDDGGPTNVDLVDVSFVALEVLPGDAVELTVWSVFSLVGFFRSEKLATNLMPGVGGNIEVVPNGETILR